MTRQDSVASAHSRLRRLIVRGAIAPGSELSQVELARRVGVSTTPLREALRRLEAEGLVDFRHNRRPRVRPFDIEELDSIYAARILLEGLALRLTVPAMADEQLARLHETIVEMACAKSRRGSATARYEDAHVAFHQELVAGAAQGARATPCAEALRSAHGRGGMRRHVTITAMKKATYAIAKTQSGKSKYKRALIQRCRKPCVPGIPARR